MSAVIITFLYFVLICNGVHSYCIMFGECHYDSYSDKLKNCYYEEGTKEAEPINKTAENYDEAVTNLKNYCPYLFHDDEGNEKGLFN